MCTLGYQINFVPMTFLTTYLFKILRRHTVLRIACVTMIVGAWMRLLTAINDQFAYVILGQIVVMSTAPIYLNCISLLANVWFPDNERASAGALMTLSSPLGSMISFVIQGYYIVQVNTDPDPTSETVKQAMYDLLTFESILITVASLILLVVIREKPEHPPSKIAITKKEDEEKGVCRTYQQLLLMKNYMLLVFVFTVLFAIYIALATIIDPLLTPFGYEPGVIAILGAVFIVAGVISTMIIGILLDKTKKYLFILRLTTFMSFFSTAIAYFILPLNNTVLCIIVITVVGFCLVPIMAVGFAFATELTHPIPPVFSNGFMLCCSNIFAWLLSFLLLYIMAATPDRV